MFSGSISSVNSCGWFAGKIGLVRTHVEVPVTAEDKGDHLFLAALLAAQRLVNRPLDHMGGLGGRHDALGAGEEHPALETLQLVIGHGLHLAGV